MLCLSSPSRSPSGYLLPIKKKIKSDCFLRGSSDQYRAAVRHLCNRNTVLQLRKIITIWTLSSQAIRMIREIFGIDSKAYSVWHYTIYVQQHSSVWLFTGSLATHPLQIPDRKVSREMWPKWPPAPIKLHVTAFFTEYCILCKGLQYLQLVTFSPRVLMGALSRSRFEAVF